MIDTFLWIPYETETELSGFVINKCDLGIVMGSYLWQHLFQWDVVIDNGLWHCDGVSG